ncbi:MAG: hypothetical protein [Circular genetic element sp.]|nr:MAG: hypothetical protein [Circular genetic element sp.]
MNSIFFDRQQSLALKQQSLIDEGLFIDTDSETTTTGRVLLDAPVVSTHSEDPQERLLIEEQLYEIMNRPMSNTHAYTLTLKPTYHNMSNHEQYLLFKSHLNDMVKTYECVYYFSVELTKLGNIHLHGVIDVGYETNRKRIEAFLRKLGYIESKLLFHSQGWLDYMFKDKSEYDCIHNLK